MMTIKTFMNKIKFLVTIFILTFTVSCGQQKRYVSYKVQQGETIDDIANRLNMDTKDLLRLNPDVDKKPAANTIIIIPDPLNKGKQTTENKKVVELEQTQPEKVSESEIETETSTTETSTQPETVTVERLITTYDTHTVQPKETVYALTKKYGITKDELIRLNPEFPKIKDNILGIGQVLKIKEIITKTYVSTPKKETKDYITHTVQPKETVYSLTRFYNISKDELVRLNPHLPNLKDNNLGVGEVLKIKSIKEKLETDSNAVYIDSIQFGNTINLALLLPFRTKKYDSISAVDIFSRKKSTNRKSDINIANMVTDFYMGAEIAIDSVKNQGIDVQVKVFDTGDKGKNIPVILTQNNLNDKNVIIGPFYSDKAKLVADNISPPVVFPHFSNKQDAFSSSRLIKAAPDTQSYVNELVSFLKTKYNGETIFVVGDGKSASNRQISNIVNSLKQHDSINEITVLKPKKGYIKKERFTDKMKAKSHCWIIMTANDKVIVSDALNSMIVLPEEVTAQVFAVEMNKAYSSIDNNKLARIGFTYVTNSFIDDSDSLTKEFNKKYRRKNHSLPSEYATKGFDITYDILIRLASGEKLSKTFNQGTSIRIANKFNYNKRLFGSTSNKGLFIVKYNKDLSLNRLR